MSRGTGDPRQVVFTHVEVDGGRLRGCVAEKQLDMVKVSSCLKQVGSETVS